MNPTAAVVWLTPYLPGSPVLHAAPEGHEQLRYHTWSEEQNDMIKEAAGSRPAVALAGAFYGQILLTVTDAKGF